MPTQARLTALICVMALTAACAGGDERGADDTTARDREVRPPRVPQPAALTPPPIPDHGAYLGAWINPTGPERERVRAAGLPRDQVAAMREAVGSLGILHLYARWNAPAPVTALQGISAAAAVPVLAWGCGPYGRIAEGLEDEHIRSYAEALRSFGRPLFLRYAWEMNLGTPRNGSCEAETGPAGFVAAWRRVRQIFRDVGADNVAFVWCPGIGRPTTWRSYFPGADAVDWIGVDGYVLDPSPATAATAFTSVFGPFYAEFAGESKPLMVAETGARAGAQGEYLAGVAALLPQAYPQVKAFAYFDAPGPRGDWSLSDDGRPAFSSLVTNPYFAFHG
jgi:hypothetical protein